MIIRTLPIFVVPLLIIFTGTNKKIDYYIVRQYFIFGIFLSSLISISAAAMKLLAGNNYQDIVYFGFTEPFGLHPSYYSLYILTSLIFLLEAPKLLLPIFKSFVAITLATALLLAQSKIALVIFVLLAMFYLAQSLKNKVKKQSILITVLLLGFVGSGIFIGGGRLSELTKTRQSNEIGTFSEDGISQRIWLWRTAAEHMQDKPIFGFGLGAQEGYFGNRVAKDLLRQDLDATYIKASKALSHFNFHNNYVQIWYELGWAGSLLFLVGIVGVLIYGFKSRAYQGILIYGIFLFILTVEVMLNRQMGIYFYSFISIFLLFENQKEKGNEL
ncbi:O-antigen ligase family protein [Flagellimonas sp. 2504JD1-5]